MNIFSLQIRNLILVLVAVFLAGCEKQYTETQINPVLVIRNQNSTVKAIALTFDDGPDKVWTGMILDILKEKNVKATFFLLGDKMTKYPNVTKRIFEEGHVVANHTSNHLKLPGRSFQEIYKDIMRTDKLIDSLYGGSHKLFRPPWGLITKGQKDSLSRYGFRVILWDIDSKDYSKKSSSDKIVDKVIHDAQNNNIILLHDSDYTCKNTRKHTVHSLRRIIDGLRNQGYVFVKVNELVNLGSISTYNENIISEDADQLQL